MIFKYLILEMFYYLSFHSLQRQGGKKEILFLLTYTYHTNTPQYWLLLLNRYSIKHHTKLQLFFLFLTRGNILNSKQFLLQQPFWHDIKRLPYFLSSFAKTKKTISHVVWERRRRRFFSALDNIMEILSAMEGNVLELKLSTLLFFKVSIRRAKVLLCAASLCVEMNNVWIRLYKQRKWNTGSTQTKDYHS